MALQDDPDTYSELKSGPLQSGKDLIGPVAFVLMTVAVLVFFWWLLIYDHGVVSVH